MICAECGRTDAKITKTRTRLLPFGIWLWAVCSGGHECKWRAYPDESGEMMENEFSDTKFRNWRKFQRELNPTRSTEDE